MIKIAKKILIIDDDKNICEILKMYLLSEGYEVLFAHDGSEGINVTKENNPNLILLDIMLPIISGWEVCKLLRNFTDVPIIMLTAMDTIENKIEGLNIGADDYIVKPFDPKEVIARVAAHLRRQENKSSQVEEENKNSITKYDNLQIDIDKYEIILDGNNITGLKPKEIQLMHFFMVNKNQVFSRDQLLEKVWGYGYFGGTRTVDVHVNNLREKLFSEKNKWEIKTIWNVGYKFETKDGN